MGQPSKRQLMQPQRCLCPPISHFLHWRLSKVPPFTCATLADIQTFAVTAQKLAKINYKTQPCWIWNEVITLIRPSWRMFKITIYDDNNNVRFIYIISVCTAILRWSKSLLLNELLHLYKKSHADYVGIGAQKAARSPSVFLWAKVFMVYNTSSHLAPCRTARCYKA